MKSPDQYIGVFSSLYDQADPETRTFIDYLVKEASWIEFWAVMAEVHNWDTQLQVMGVPHGTDNEPNRTILPRKRK